MIITYHFKTRRYDEVFLENEPDPMSGEVGVWLFSQRKYVSVFFIFPLFAQRAVVEAYSENADQPIPVALWSENMMAEGDRLLSEVGSWWRYCWFVPLLLASLLTFAMVGYYTATASKRLEAQLAEYIADPRVGDIVIGTIEERPGDYETEYRTAFVITRMDDEFIYARRSTERKDGGWKRIREREKIARQFDISPSMFSGEEERFSRSMYPHKSGSHSLQDVSMPFKERRSSISVDFVIRP